MDRDSDKHLGMRRCSCSLLILTTFSALQIYPEIMNTIHMYTTSRMDFVIYRR